MISVLLASGRVPKSIAQKIRQDGGGTFLRRNFRLRYTPTVVEEKINKCWRKARIAARLLLKKEARRPWNARDRALATRFADDDGVTNRLIDQAVKYLKAPL